VNKFPYCPECTPEKSCGKGHLYVRKFPPEYAKKFPNRKSAKGHLYVGKTGVSVMERHEANWVTYGGRKSGSSAECREFCDRYEPDFAFQLIDEERFQNPIEADKSDKDKLGRLEGMLADKLRKDGWWVEGASWKKEKRKRKAKRKELELIRLSGGTCASGTRTTGE
jgi:hypothetical protein